MSLRVDPRNPYSSPYPAFSAGTARKPAYAFRSASSTPAPQFGGACTQRLRSFWTYLQDRDNRKLFKSFLYQFGIPSLLGFSLLTGPIGLALCVVGIPISIFLARRGETLLEEAVEKINATGRRRGEPFKRLAQMANTWFNTTEDAAKRFGKEYNRFLGDILGNEKNSFARSMRKFLTLHPGSRRANWVKAILSVKAMIAERWYGKAVNWVTNTMRRVPFLKSVALALSIAPNALFLLFNYKQVGKIFRQYGAKLV